MFDSHKTLQKRYVLTVEHTATVLFSERNIWLRIMCWLVMKILDDNGSVRLINIVVSDNVPGNETCFTYTQVHAAISAAFVSRRSSQDGHKNSSQESSKWSILNSAFFATTVVTTIGKRQVKSTDLCVLMYYQKLWSLDINQYICHIPIHFCFKNQSISVYTAMIVCCHITS